MGLQRLSSASTFLSLVFFSSWSKAQQQQSQGALTHGGDSVLVTLILFPACLEPWLLSKHILFAAGFLTQTPSSCATKSHFPLLADSCLVKIPHFGAESQCPGSWVPSVLLASSSSPPSSRGGMLGPYLRRTALQASRPLTQGIQLSKVRRLFLRDGQGQPNIRSGWW